MNFFNMFNQQQQQHQQQQTSVDNMRLYKLLGVSKNANEKEIKKAYLKKSMKGEYRHPDKGGSNENFQKLSLAYNTLKDKDKRRLYNKYGEDSLKPDFSEPVDIHQLFGNQFGFHSNMQRMPQKPKKGNPIVHQIKVSLENLCKGFQKSLKITRKVIINTNNNQVIDDNEIEKSCINCNHCNGTGRINITRQIGPGMIQQIQSQCHYCQGKCKQLKNQYKIIEKSEKIDIYIQKGMEHGDKIKVEGKGNMSPGSLPSDIVFVIIEEPHTTFQRKGNDLLIKRKISLVDALCGFEFLVKHPEGKYIVVKSKKIIYDKAIKCINNGGMPLKNDQFSYGKLFIVFSVVYPKEKEMNQDFKNLLRKLFLHVKSYHSLNNSVAYVKKEIENLPENTELDTEELLDVDPNLFGKKANYKGANDSDSEDENPNVQRCHTM